MYKEKLSVIVPVYNVEKYLRQCLDSILTQTYSNMEIILVDDGSTDGCNVICDEYAKRDERVYAIHKDNGGLISARMAGLMRATSEFVTFVDSDDWIQPLMYESLMQKILTYNVDLVTSGCIRYCNEEKCAKSYDEIIDCGLYNAEEIEKKIIPCMLWKSEIRTWGLDPSLCTKIFRREILLRQYKHMQNEIFYYGEDTAIIYPYILEIKSMLCTWDTFYFHRQRENGVAPRYYTEDDFFDNLMSLYHFLHDIFIQSKHSETLIMQLDFFYINSVQNHSFKYNIDYKARYMSKKVFLFPFHKVSPGSSVILYGAGRVGIQYFTQITKLNFCRIAGWVDQKYETIKNYKIQPIEIVKDVDYDYIVLAILNENVRQEVRQELREYGVGDEKIIDCVTTGNFY